MIYVLEKWLHGICCFCIETGLRFSSQNHKASPNHFWLQFQKIQHFFLTSMALYAHDIHVGKIVICGLFYKWLLLQACTSIPVMVVLWKLRQEDCKIQGQIETWSECRDSLDYVARPLHSKIGVYKLRSFYLALFFMLDVQFSVSCCIYTVYNATHFPAL